MQMINKLFNYKLLILLIIFAVSCSNSTTSPGGYYEEYVRPTGIQTLHYGSKTIELDVDDEEKLKELWINMNKDKIVYGLKNYSSITGKFDSKANYYDKKSGTSSDFETAIRTKFIKCMVHKYNGKYYIAAVYWDNKDIAMHIHRYRLLIVDEHGAEVAWYGGENDPNTIPEYGTRWYKYNFVFGYIKDY